MTRLRPSLALFVMVPLLAAWRMHPIHAARVELDAAADGSVNAIVHVYRDDFPGQVTLASIGGYLDKALVVTDARGTRLILRPTALQPEGDRLKILLTGSVSGGIAHGRIALTLLQEKFADQVNVVDARVQGRRAQLVFLRGDASQALP